MFKRSIVTFLFLVMNLALLSIGFSEEQKKEGGYFGAKTATQHFRNTTDTKNTVTATVDEDGNRTGITLDVSD